MANTFKKIASLSASSGEVASFNFTGIPSSYKDLYISLSARSSNSSNFDNPRVAFNTNTSDFSRIEFYSENASLGSEAASDRIIGVCPAGNTLSNSFGALKMYVPNYAGSNNKPYSVFSTSQHSSSTPRALWYLGGIWQNTSAISQITITLNSGANFVQYSTATLYGI
jgi:hypothetical protein